MYTLVLKPGVFALDPDEKDGSWPLYLLSQALCGHLGVCFITLTASFFSFIFALFAFPLWTDTNVTK